MWGESDQWNVGGFLLLQGNYACHVEATEIQVPLLVCHTVRFHTNTSFCYLCLLGFWWWAPEPFQRLLSPPQKRLAWHRRYTYAHPPGSTLIISYTKLSMRNDLSHVCLLLFFGVIQFKGKKKSGVGMEIKMVCSNHFPYWTALEWMIYLLQWTDIISFFGELFCSL